MLVTDSLLSSYDQHQSSKSQIINCFGHETNVTVLLGPDKWIQRQKQQHEWAASQWAGAGWINVWSTCPVSRHVWNCAICVNINCKKWQVTPVTIIHIIDIYIVHCLPLHISCVLHSNWLTWLAKYCIEGSNI